VNNLYQYSYKNGLQFVTTAEPLVLGIGLALQSKFDEISPIEVPKLIGVWKFKEVKNIKKS
jgi:hypothetical protein